jgi:uncharacterized protein (TIGR00296 family)
LAKLINFDLSINEGIYLVNLARSSIESHLRKEEAPSLKKASSKLKTKCGVFVTLNRVTGSHHNLRGCIGFPYPIKPLNEAVSEVAISAAFKDPRFPEITIVEMENIVVEVSVLTPPERIVVESPLEIPIDIQIGRDGLIVERGYYRGLLLPQVAVEWKWDAEEFLSQCCIKANLPPDSWLLPETMISRFRAIIFSETKPRGNVERIEFNNIC